MRPIEYRGICIETKELIFGSLVIPLSDRRMSKHYIVTYDKNNKPIFNEVFSNSVAAYIGMTDKNDEKIYEGDTVLIGPDKKGGEIKWVPEHCCFLIRQFEPHSYHYLESDGKLNNIEVVGRFVSVEQSKNIIKKGAI